MPLWNPDTERFFSGGRASVVSGDPYPTTDQLTKSTIYYIPSGPDGNSITLLNSSSQMVNVQFSELSVAVPSTTNNSFDIFGYASGGTMALETLNWTNYYTRATAVTLVGGMWTKSGDPTRRLLASACTTGTSGKIEDSRTRRLLYNVNNQIVRFCWRQDNNVAAYTTAAWREWNNWKPGVSVGGTGGVWGATGTYYYQIEAYNSDGELIGVSKESAGAVVTATTQKVTLTWTAVDDVSVATYKIYRTTVSGTYTPTALRNTFTKTVSYSSGETYVDDGTATTTGAIGTSRTSYVRMMTGLQSTFLAQEAIMGIAVGEGGLALDTDLYGYYGNPVCINLNAGYVTLVAAAKSVVSAARHLYETTQLGNASATYNDWQLYAYQMM